MVIGRWCGISMIKLLVLILMFIMPQPYWLMVGLSVLLDVFNQDFLGTALLCYVSMLWVYEQVNDFVLEVLAYTIILAFYVVGMSLIMRVLHFNAAPSLSYFMMSLISLMAVVCSSKKRLSF